MARRARDNVATLRRNSAGWTPVRIGRLSSGAGRRFPHNLQGVIDGMACRVNEAGVSTAAPDRRAVQYCRMDQS